MDNTIKETLRVLDLNEISTNESFVNFAVTILATGKKGNVGNSAQLPYFAIHLSCLKNSVNFEVDHVQKKSTLNQKLYQSSLMAILKSIDPTTIINIESISKYYGCPSLKGLIEEIQAKANDKSIEGAIAAVYLIGQMTKIKHFGTLADLSKLWIQSVETLRQVANELKVHCDAMIKLKDFGKILTDEIKQSKQVEADGEVEAEGGVVSAPHKRTSSPRSASKNAKVIKATNHSSLHPLILLNCSSSGPAFGPIL